MDAYLEIRLLPDPEFAPTTLMNVLFSKLHHALTALGGGKIGVSFPDVEPKKPALGQRLRLHGSQADLAALMASSLLVGMRDHTAVTAIAEVPAHAKARVVRRVHEKAAWTGNGGGSRNVRGQRGTGAGDVARQRGDQTLETALRDGEQSEHGSKIPVVYRAFGDSRSSGAGKI